jgi:hypothetical protein
MPVSLNTLPVRNLTIPQNVFDFMGLAFCEGFVSDIVIHILVEEPFSLRDSRFLVSD